MIDNVFSSYLILKLNQMRAHYGEIKGDDPLFAEDTFT